ncbi:MAG: molybdate ABC transporter permease subunit [Planctomycetota bacterium]|nr:molybdate ABC transporter permease subunit [Planctomycetota bacterium]
MHQLGLTVLTLILAIAGCESRQGAADRQPELVVFAAASVADALHDIADAFEADNGIRIEISAAASGVLRIQIESGAPCDVFVSADPLHMDRLATAGLILLDTRTDIASNTLVIVTRETQYEAWTSPEPLAESAVGRIAIAHPDYAPAGRYARSALEHHNLWSRVEPRIVFGDNVRLTLQQLLIGGLRCGIVYASDVATTDALDIAYRFDPKSHPPIRYPAAVIRRANVHPAANAFCRFLGTDAARSILRSHGFTDVPRSEDPPEVVERLGPAQSVDDTAMPIASESLFDESLMQALTLSVRVSIVALLFCLPIGVLTGTWLARTRSAWRPIVELAITCPLVIPPVVTGLVVLYLVVRMRLPVAYTWWAAAIASAIVALPLLVRTVRAAVEAMDDRLPLVAATLGASRTRVFLTITLPLSWRGVVGGAVLAWARAAGEFGATIVVAGNTPGKTQTIPLAIYSALHSPDDSAVWPLVAVAVLMSVAAVAISEALVRSKRKQVFRAPRNGH